MGKVKTKKQMIMTLFHGIDQEQIMTTIVLWHRLMNERDRKRERERERGRQTDTGRHREREIDSWV